MRINLAKIQKRITRRDDKVFGIINYDVGNDYPQKVTDIVNGSGVAVSCLDIFKKFVTGKGFSDASFGETIRKKSLRYDVKRRHNVKKIRKQYREKSMKT